MIFWSFKQIQKEHLERLEEIFGRLWPSKTQTKQVSRWERGSELLWVQSKLGKSWYSFFEIAIFRNCWMLQRYPSGEQRSIGRPLSNFNRF